MHSVLQLKTNYPILNEGQEIIAEIYNATCEKEVATESFNVFVLYFSWKR